MPKPSKKQVSDSESEVDEPTKTKKPIVDDDSEDDTPKVVKNRAPVKAASSSTRDSQERRKKYAVVFFVKYPNYPRPSENDIGNFFSGYGDVDHVYLPEGKDYGRVYMESLNTPKEKMRVYETKCQIINNMDPDNRFIVEVAKRNSRGKYYIPNIQMVDMNYYGRIGYNSRGYGMGRPTRGYGRVMDERYGRSGMGRGRGGYHEGSQRGGPRGSRGGRRDKSPNRNGGRTRIGRFDRENNNY